MTEGSVGMCTGVQSDPPAVVLIFYIGSAPDDQVLLVKMTTPQAVDDVIEALKLARTAAFGLDVPSRQPLGFRYHRTG